MTRHTGSSRTDGFQVMTALTVAVLMVTPGLALPVADLVGTAGTGGPGAGSEAAVPGTSGEWTGPYDAEVPAINLALRPDGTVVYYDGDHPHDTDDPTAWTFFTDTIIPSRSRVLDLSSLDGDGDPAIVRPLDDPAADLFCSGTTVRPDGSVLTVGGTTSVAWVNDSDPAGPVKGTDHTYRLGFADDDGDTGDGADAPAWERLPDMHLRRWYPTALELPDGRVLAASGIKNLSDPRTNNVILEVLDEDEGETGDGWQAHAPDLRIPPGVDVPHLGQEGDTELAAANLPLYPRLFVVPGGPLKGQVFYPSNGDIWGAFGERPEEALWGTYQALDMDTDDGTWRWTVLGHSALGVRHLGATVPLMLDPAEGYVPTLLTFGGTVQRSTVATDTAERVTLDTDRPEPELAEPLNHARWQPMGLLLPTGDVLAVGGSELDTTILHGQHVPYVMTPELYDPSTDTWTDLADMQVPRGYHSTAVLTPDATVLVGGHVENPVPFTPFRNDNSTDHTPLDDTMLNQSHVSRDSFEVFRPPYLTVNEAAGESRPRIVEVSGDPAAHQGEARVVYGDRFEVTVENLERGADAVDSVVLVRPGSSTHGLNADQRGVRLEVLSTHLTKRVGTFTLTLEAPPDGAVAPPGHYMLFVNEDTKTGVPFPSPGVFVEVGPPLPDTSTT